MRIEKLHSFNFIITKTKTNIKKMNCNARGYVLFFLFLFSPLVCSQCLYLNFVKVLIAGVLYFSRMSNRFVFYSGTIGPSHSITSCYIVHIIRLIVTYTPMCFFLIHPCLNSLGSRKERIFMRCTSHLDG